MSTHARLRALLEMSRCDVVPAPENPRILLVSSFTPLGQQSCIAIAADAARHTTIRAGPAELIEFAESGAAARAPLVVYIPEDWGVEDEPKDEVILTTEDLHVVEMALLARQVVNASRYHAYYERRLRQLLVDRGEPRPVPCRYRVGGAKAAKADDALPRMQALLSETKGAGLFLVSGGFGTGKTVLLHQLADRLARDPSQSCFPILVNLSGIGSHGLETAVEAAVGELFHSLTEDELGDLQTTLSIIAPSVKVVLLFDSLDEQSELNPSEIAKLVDKIMLYAKLDCSVVVAFRPEMFEFNIDSKLVFKDRAEARGIPYFDVMLQPFRSTDSAELVSRLLPAAQSPAVVDLAIRLSTRPIWYGLIHRLSQLQPRTGQRSLSTTAFVEFLIEQWSAREAATNRPVLIRSERDLLTTVLAACLFSGQGIQISKPRKIERSELVRFIRRLLPAMQARQDDVMTYIRWRQLPPDLTAESLAVSNLLQMDNDGLLGFSDSVFFDYYLARGVLMALTDERASSLDEKPFFELLGILHRHDLLGLIRYPTGSFVTILRELADRSATAGWDGIRANLRIHLDRLRPPPRGVTPPPVEELTADLAEPKSEEERSYQIVPQPYWMQTGTVFSAANCINWLREGSGVITGTDFSFLDLSSLTLSNTKFVNCRFTGTNFSFCRFENTTFENCDLDLALFESCIDLGTESFRSCSLDRTLFIDVEDFATELYRKQAFDLLALLQQDDEIWFSAPGHTICAENGEFPLRVPRFLADSGPVTNAQFKAFVEAVPEYSGRTHAKDIENNYYLTLLDAGGPDLPVVYVSLIAAAAYSIWKGKRLPSVAEFAIYAKQINATIGAWSHDCGFPQYDDLPPRQVGREVPYPMGTVTEWSLQIDDQTYWESVRMQALSATDERLNPFPPFRPNEGRRCEYFILGKSAQPKMNELKNSKPATWFNPDQGFRCVTDFHVAARRYVEGQ